MPLLEQDVLPAFCCSQAATPARLLADTLCGSTTSTFGVRTVWVMRVNCCTGS